MDIISTQAKFDVWDPVELSGEGNYGLGDVKQVAITDDFASMDEQTRNCQTESSFEDCVTQNILKNIVENCKCLPYNLKNYSSNEYQVLSRIRGNKKHCIDHCHWHCECFL